MIPGRTFMKRLRRAGAVSVALLLLMQFGSVRADTRSELEEAKKRLGRIEQDLEDATARKRAVEAEIESLTRQLTEAVAQKQALEGRIEFTRDEIKRGDARAERLQDRVNARARNAYIQGPMGVFDFIFEADSLTNLSDRVSFLDMLSWVDAGTVAGLEIERDLLAEHRDDLDGLIEDQVDLLAQLEAQGRQLERKWEEAAAIEDEIQDKLADAEDAVKTLRRRLRVELLASIQGQFGNTGPPLDADGPFYWCPVDAPRSYINDFGYPRVGHTHQGNDIFAQAGTPIRAPFDGVARESTNGLGGISVHVYRDNGDYVYNAHLSRWAGVNGARVKPGDVVGYVGNTGNAAGTPPHDHFEYHPGGGSAVTPYFYLNEVCGVGGRG